MSIRYSSSNITFFFFPIVIELQLLFQVGDFIVQFGINFITARSSPARQYNARLHLRSFKKQSGNLILCCVGWEDTFIYHNNKDNSIKTPIIARYNRQGRGNTILFIYHFLSMNLIGLPGRRLYLQPVKSLLPARYLLDSNGLQQQQSRPGWQTLAGGDLLAGHCPPPAVISRRQPVEPRPGLPLLGQPIFPVQLTLCFRKEARNDNYEWE